MFDSAATTLLVDEDTTYQLIDNPFEVRGVGTGADGNSDPEIYL